MHHNRKQGRPGDASGSFRSFPAALLLQYILLSCARLPTYCFRKPSVSAIHPRNLFAHNLHPAARIMRTTAQCMIVFHKEFAHTALCLFHRAAAVSTHHILIHMCCGERRGTRLNRGDIVLPQKFRNRSPICPWRDRNLAQVRQLPYIFPARVIRLTAPVSPCHPSRHLPSISAYAAPSPTRAPTGRCIAAYVRESSRSIHFPGR